MIHDFERVFVPAYESVTDSMFVLNDAWRIIVMTGVPAKLAGYFRFYSVFYNFVISGVFAGEKQRCHYCDDQTMWFHDCLDYLTDVTRPADFGSAGIFARDACLKDTKRAHGVSRAGMPALPGQAFQHPLFNH
ncbi:MAG: hypothetical protein LBM04_09335 [Opitutaceae bacterium]|jgi:hypothetical protein|nr:hypothetical protein [Opitutaceae bacterium]